MCATSLSRETIVALKYIQRLSIKTKPKVAFTLKTKTNPIVTLILETQIKKLINTNCRPKKYGIYETEADVMYVYTLSRICHKKYKNTLKEIHTKGLANQLLFYLKK